MIYESKRPIGIHFAVVKDRALSIVLYWGLGLPSSDQVRRKCQKMLTPKHNRSLDNLNAQVQALHVWALKL